MKLKSTRTKKQQKEFNKKNRILVPFNIGTRTHKSPKDYRRLKRWEVCDE